MKNLMFLTLFLLANVLTAQEIKDFSLTNTKDGKAVSLSGFSSTGIAVVFTSHECPFDNYYKERLKELTTQYAGKIQFVFINSNQKQRKVWNKWLFITKTLTCLTRRQRSGCDGSFRRT